MVELRKFDKHDYDGWAGVEGDNPMIGEIEHPEYETDGWIIVVDVCGMEVSYVRMGHEDIVWILEATQGEAEMVAALLTADNIEFLLEKGMKFKRVSKLLTLSPRKRV